MIELVGGVLILLGAAFHFSAGLGMLRMPDVYTRMQAATKASTLGNTLVLAGIAFFHPGWSLKLIVIVYFVFMTNPVSSHALARAANAIRNSMGRTVVDALCDARQDRQRVTWRILVAIVVASFGLIFATLAISHVEQQSLRPLAESYVRLVPEALRAPNVVTGILLTYRAFDTLGEVAVLFMVAAGVGLVLTSSERGNDDAPGRGRRAITQSSEIVRTGAQVLGPLSAIFAAYIIMNGHLSAGGGFQGGAVIASGIVLMLLASPSYQLDLKFLSVAESAAGVLFVVSGIAGLLFAGGFLDNRILPLGQFGAFFSAGAIPLLSVLLGVKVGCELSVILDRFRP